MVLSGKDLCYVYEVLSAAPVVASQGLAQQGDMPTGNEKGLPPPEDELPQFYIWFHPPSVNRLFTSNLSEKCSPRYAEPRVGRRVD